MKRMIVAGLVALALGCLGLLMGTKARAAVDPVFRTCQEAGAGVSANPSPLGESFGVYVTGSCPSMDGLQHAMFRVKVNGVVVANWQPGQVVDGTALLVWYTPPKAGVYTWEADVTRFDVPFTPLVFTGWVVVQ